MALSLEDRLVVARHALGRSVVAINPHAQEQAAHKAGGPCTAGRSDGSDAGSARLLTFGVKDHGAIPSVLIERIASAADCVMLTVDHMADLGRSVDTELVNPLTYRPMTGSTSGGPINVLKGINDFCIGTDGGGSVLAPALATNLFAVMCKGLGLVTGGESVSTDGLAFRGGVGFIGRSLDVVVRAAELASGFKLLAADGLPEVIVPMRGSVSLPDGSDMRGLLSTYLEGSEIPVSERAFFNLYDRERTVRDLDEIWRVNPTSCVITYEGPIDVLSADETIPRCFGGPVPAAVAGVRSKAQVKAVNIAGGSAVCIPVGNLACGLVISCGQGYEAFCGALSLARLLERVVSEVCPLPELFSRYFLNRGKAPHPLDPCW